ncbi:MAG: DUF1232 domain-containing protein [Proteobacteria bacterium]|nr:DUF1232 domain-containing protein [Pseudomonadota bacterium]
MSAGGNETSDLGGADDDSRNDEFALTVREQKVRSEFWDKFKRVARRIPFAGNLLAAYYCAMDSRTPLRVRTMLLAALAYFIMPMDAIPDIIAGLGFTDDAAVMAAAIGAVRAALKPPHFEKARAFLAKEKPADEGEEAKE